MGPIPNRKGCTLAYLLWFELAHFRGLGFGRFMD